MENIYHRYINLPFNLEKPERIKDFFPEHMKHERIDDQSKKTSRHDAYKNFVSRQPIGRFGSPDEVASLALYLASDCSKYTTGSVNVIDGGWSN